MKTCPYILSGLLSSDKGFVYFDRFKDRALCLGENCGRYSLCNQETTQKKEHPQENKVHLFQLLYSVPIRERNVIISAIAKHGIEYVELMTLKEWAQEKNCGLKMAHYIMDFLHGNKDDNA